MVSVVWQLLGKDEFEHRAAVFDAGRLPEFARVCEEVEGGSIGFAERRHRLAGRADLFAHDRLLRFEVADALLVGCHHRIAGGIHDAIKKLIDLLGDETHILFQRFGLHAHTRGLAIPQFAEHIESEIEQPFGWLEVGKQHLELALYLFLADGFAVVGATLGVAKIVWVSGAAPLRPAGGQRLATAPAGDEAAQRKVLAQILARRSLGNAVAALLYRLIGFEGDQRLVLGGNERQAPTLIRDMACIDWARHEFGHPLLMHLALVVLRIGWLAFKKALHFHLCFKAARGIAVQRFGDDRCHRLVAHQQLAVSGDLLVAIADRRIKHPITVHCAGAHPVLGLLAVLLALVLRDGGEQVLNENGIGILAELDGRADQLAACVGDRCAQLDMRLYVTRKARYVVNDDGAAFGAMLLQKVQHRDHGGTRGAPAADIVAEDFHDFIVLVGRIFAAARFLAR